MPLDPAILKEISAWLRKSQEDLHLAKDFVTEIEKILAASPFQTRSLPPET